MRPLRWRGGWLSGGVALLLLVAFLTLRPKGVPLPGVSHADKLAHALAYFTLAAWFGGVFRPERYLALALSLIAFGVVLELLQALMPQRFADGYDMLANATGVGLGVVACALGLGGWCQWIENRVHERHA